PARRRVSDDRHRHPVRARREAAPRTGDRRELLRARPPRRPFGGQRSAGGGTRFHGLSTVLRLSPSRDAGLRSPTPAGALHRFTARDLDARRSPARAQEEGFMKPKVVVIVLLIAVGAAGYWYWQRQRAAAPLVLSGSIE